MNPDEQPPHQRQRTPAPADSAPMASGNVLPAETSADSKADSVPPLTQDSRGRRMRSSHRR